MIVCPRSVHTPAEVRDRYLDWIAEGRAIRQAHGILAELVCDSTSGNGDTIVITMWPDDATFDAWVATPERDAFTASDLQQAVDYRPITRHQVIGGYINLTALHQPEPSPKEHP
jgi:heme-degrading monooxygenase HmoA